MDPSVRYVSQNFVDDMLDALLERTNAPKEPCCSICNQMYGEADAEAQEANDDTALTLLNALPMIANFTQEIVKPVVTPCGHNFCTFCICTWLSDHSRCPLCRAHFDVPHETHDFNPDDLDDGSDEDLDESFDEHLRNYGDYDDDDSRMPFYNRYRQYVEQLTTRQMLTCDSLMLFASRPQEVEIALQGIMSDMAQRFYLQARGDIAPEVMHDMRFPVSDELLMDSRGELDYYVSDSPHALLTSRCDYHKLSRAITDCVKRVDAASPKRKQWEDAAEQVYAMVEAEMPNANGGLDSNRWWAYVRCVIRYLLVDLIHRQRLSMLYMQCRIRC